MEIQIDKPVAKIVYNTHRGDVEKTLEDGVIFSEQELISPMRDRFESGLSKKEPHIGFKNGKGVVFIPIKDITTLDYY